MMICVCCVILQKCVSLDGWTYNLGQENQGRTLDWILRGKSPVELQQVLVQQRIVAGHDVASFPFLGLHRTR
jgi:hypothetical protein